MGESSSPETDNEAATETETQEVTTAESRASEAVRIEGAAEEVKSGDAAESEGHKETGEQVASEVSSSSTEKASEKGDDTEKASSCVRYWNEYWDAGQSKTYYHDPKTGETRWDLPEGDKIMGSELKGKVTLKRRKETETATSELLPRNKKPLIDWAALADQYHLSDERYLPMPEPFCSLPKKLSVFIKHDTAPTAEEMGRPAKVQVKPEELANTAYHQGNEEYNIWYGKYASYERQDRRSRERPAAAYHCNPLLDSGFTKADLSPDLEGSPFCLYFAKGACSQGVNCRYKHRVPTRLDNDRLDTVHDIFGRERHARHRDDMEGVGTFNQPCKTLFVGEFRVDRTDPEFVTKTEQSLLRHFCIWGPIEQIRYLPNKSCAFITFGYRAAAEFAKIAMADYKLDCDDDVIYVKWAQADKSLKDKDNRREFKDAERVVSKRIKEIKTGIKQF